MTPVALSELTGHLAEVAPGLTERAARLFRDNGFAKVGFLAPSSVTGAVRREAERLVAAHGARRDLRFAETGHTMRRMRNVRRCEIHQHGCVIPALYGGAVLRHAVEPIVGEEVLPCPYEPEQYVITELTAQGDTHGWHWDDYSFALVWVLESPPAEEGGFVQFVPNTVWDKTNPRLHRHFIDHPIHSVELAAGDLYLMRTNTTLHRVYPLGCGRRLIVNMAYASREDLDKPISHETMDTLWGSP